MTYDELRREYPLFIFEGYEYLLNEDSLSIEYKFKILGLAEFCPKWNIKISDNKNREIKDIEKMVFSLGLAELISYWKITCSPNVDILAGSLTNDEIVWWKNQYFNGLGEFFHINKINTGENSFMNINPKGKYIASVNVKINHDAGNLIPVGGGKDSAVTLELLRGLKNQNYCYIINPRGATLDTCKAGGYNEERIITASRTLDKNMLELNKKGFLNGHTPFSAIVAFSGILAAYLNNLKYVVLSNESSANESTVSGSEVNHQYSKSFKFEGAFHNYEKQFIKSGVYYFSLLRPLSEFQIAKYFSRLYPYHKIFKSCNAGSKADIWCRNCPKCLFVFIILSPFLDYGYLCEIFGEDLLSKVELKKDFDKLTGALPEKPFECVGSRDEINTALVLLSDKLKKENIDLPYLLKYYDKTGFGVKYSKGFEYFNNYYDKENLLPQKFKNILIKELF